MTASFQLHAKSLFEFIFPFSVTGYRFDNIFLHQIRKKFRSIWTFQCKKFHNCTSAEYFIKTKLLKKSMDMNSSLSRKTFSFFGKYTFNVHFFGLNVYFFIFRKSTYDVISAARIKSCLFIGLSTINVWSLLWLILVCSTPSFCYPYLLRLLISHYTIKLWFFKISTGTKTSVYHLYITCVPRVYNDLKTT